MPLFSLRTPPHRMRKKKIIPWGNYQFKFVLIPPSPIPTFIREHSRHSTFLSPQCFKNLNRDDPQRTSHGQPQTSIWEIVEYRGMLSIFKEISIQTDTFSCHWTYSGHHCTGPTQLHTTPMSAGCD